MAAVVGLFIIRSPSTAAHEVFPSTEEKWKGVKRSGVVDGARCGLGNNNISRSLKLNNGSCRYIQMVITYHTEDRFRRIIY